MQQGPGPQTLLQGCQGLPPVCFKIESLNKAALCAIGPRGCNLTLRNISSDLGIVVCLVLA